MVNLPLACTTCALEGRRPIPITRMPVNDEGIYAFTCEHGHHHVVILQEQKFEVLYELGARALLDGNPRDCVTAIAASVERFYEFYLNVMALKYAIEPQEFQQTWKLLSAQSERQFGAFVMTYSVSNRRSPVRLENKWAELRNNVIHKGYLPNADEAMGYAERIYNLLCDYLNELKEQEREILRKAVAVHVSKLRQLAIENGTDTNKPFSGMSSSTMISVSSGMKFTFYEALNHLRSRVEQGL
jgi:hypothetical protein